MENFLADLTRAKEHHKLAPHSDNQTNAGNTGTTE